jgi:hypothetical protein
MAALALMESTSILAPVQKDTKAPTARSMLTTAVRIRVRMTALVLTASIAILVPVQKDSKELTETNIARAVRFLKNRNEVCFHMTTSFQSQNKLLDYMSVIINVAIWIPIMMDISKNNAFEHFRGILGK